MAVFLGIHKLTPDLGEADVTKGWEAYKTSAEAAGLKPLSAFVSLEKGFAYCQTEANSGDEVRQAHANASIPLEDVVEIRVLT